MGLPGWGGGGWGGTLKASEGVDLVLLSPLASGAGLVLWGSLVDRLFMKSKAGLL